jgi:hypothetical protein
VDITNYRITVNDAQGEILSEYPGVRWAKVAEFIDARGGNAKLEQRSVFDADEENRQLFPNWPVIGNTIVQPWRVMAEITVR